MNTDMNDVRTDRPILFTEGAVRQVLRSMDAEPDARYLHLGVRTGGCAGLEYIFDFVADVPPGHEVIEYDSFACCVDPLQLTRIEGMRIDYRLGLDNRGFIFENPNADSTCGCGQSFS